MPAFYCSRLYSHQAFCLRQQEVLPNGHYTNFFAYQPTGDIADLCHQVGVLSKRIDHCRGSYHSISRPAYIGNIAQMRWNDEPFTAIITLRKYSMLRKRDKRQPV